MAVNTEQAWLVADRDDECLRIEWESAIPDQLTIKIDPNVCGELLVYEADDLEQLIKTLQDILDTKVRAQK